jgi:serine kinase of HPr protein (carbohydrate metabolism regulator)
LEEAHDTYSIHGAVLDIDGKGVTLIAPSKTGKTTQSWGLLRMSNAHLISDDWYFVRLGNGRPFAYGSEKNCYIDADIGDVWEEYKPLVSHVRFDNMGRGIANIRWVAGESSVIPMTKIRCVFLMKRDYDDPVPIRRFTRDEGLDYLLNNDLCNPHQIIWSDHKTKIRTRFLSEFLSNCDIYLVNTIRTPQETQELIRNAIKNNDVIQ